MQRSWRAVSGIWAGMLITGSVGDIVLYEEDCHHRFWCTGLLAGKRQEASQPSNSNRPSQHTASLLLHLARQPGHGLTGAAAWLGAGALRPGQHGVQGRPVPARRGWS